PPSRFRQRFECIHPGTVDLSSQSVFFHTALHSGLVTKSQLEEAVAELRAAADSRSPGSEELTQQKLAAREIANWLVEKNIVTQYQADQLCSGRTKFRLGPYIVTDYIAQGGMGQVFKAVHPMMGREVALKVLPMGKATPDAIAS